MEVEGEDWFFESITRYKDLSMFELEYPVQQVEPTSANSICVSCSNKNRHQLLELELPSKHLLQASESSETGITNNPDLKIKCGTFTQDMCFQIKTFEDHTAFASHMNKNGITLYRLSSNGSDEIKKESFIENYYESPMMALNNNGSHIWLTKKRADLICLFDINTKKHIQSIKVDERNTTFECDERIVPFYLQNDTVAFGRQLTGGIAISDPRNRGIWGMNFPLDSNSSNEANFWSFTSLHECSEKFANISYPTSIAKVSKTGTLVVYDTRNTNVPAYIDKNLGLNTSSGAPLQVRFRPSRKDWISVSGFDGNVYVYRLQSGADPELMFTHDGHKHVEGYSCETVTTSHVWSKLDKLVISSADNGTIQMWQFENKESASK